MRTRGPIVTLLAVVVLAFVLLAVNMLGNRPRTGAPNADTTPAALAAPPPSAPAAFPTRASYAGRTSGRKAGEATVEIVVRNGTAIAYLCDGKKLESWLQGKVSGSSMSLRGKGTNELTGELSPASGGGGGGGGGGEELTGTVRLAGAQWPFSAAPGKAPTAEKRAAKLAATAPPPANPVPGATSPPADPSPAPNAVNAAPATPAPSASTNDQSAASYGGGGY